MTLTVPSEIPGSFAAGDTLEVQQGPFTLPTGDAVGPADGWDLAVKIIAPSASYSATVTDDDSLTWTFTFAASATTAIVSQAVARIVGYLTGTGANLNRRYTVIDQVIVIEPNIASATGTNLKSHAERMLAIVEAALEGNTSAIQSYSIGGRAVTKYTPAELTVLRNKYADEVKRERSGRAVLGMQTVFNARH